MRWASAISERLDLAEAVAECAERVAREMDGGPIDRAVIFVSSRHAERYGDLPDLIRRQLQPGALVGCSGDGVIGGAHEVEGRPAVALTVGHMPGVKVTPFRAEDE